MRAPSYRRIFSAFLLLFAPLPLLAQTPAAADAPLVCDQGHGAYYATLRNGVEVAIGALHSSGFARRGCLAHLTTSTQDLPIAAQADAVDADLLDADLGFGFPVAAFQIRLAAADPAMRYAIYSLKRPLRLIRVLTGGASYSAADTDLDGRIEIWTSDAVAFNGFDGLRLAAFDFAPPVVLRFENQRLIDVSTEFQPDYDRRIAALRAQISPQYLALFRLTDGRMISTRPAELPILRELLGVKTKALEIVACYLWSGREAQAWAALDQLWPAADRPRVRALLLASHAHGLRAQVDSVSPGPHGARRHALLFAPLPAKENPHQSATLWGSSGAMVPISDANRAPDRVDSSAVPIQLSRPVPEGSTDPHYTATVNMRLLIDSAGKVREAYTDGAADPDLIAATAGWKFIPAFKGNRPVAGWLLLTVSPQR